jgi:hypothetical protein
MSSSLKNRVDPWGRLQSHDRRTGTRMGNRGILHNAQREVVRYSAATAWLCCSLEFKGIKRQIFQVDPKPSYSELFFLDEATALAAGHRPCNDCQPFRFQQFKQAWCSALYPDKTHRQLLIGDVDEQLRGERIGSGNEKPTFRSGLTPRSSGAPTAWRQARAGRCCLSSSARAWRHAAGARLTRTLGGISLTPRSSGAPTAGHQARSGGTRYIFASPGLASCRSSPA